MLRKALTFTYGAVAYLAFLGAFLYTIGFLAGAVVPKDVDDGTVRPVWQAVVVDLALLGLFAVQHSVMARPWFKQRWTRIVPPAIERSTYVLAATVALVLLLWLWQPWPTTVWSVDAGWARAALWSLYLLGWGFLVLSTFALGHFDLFGLRQVLARRHAEPSFREPPLYRVIRHPIMVGFLIAFWAVPDMSAGRLLFAAASTAYIMVGVRLEEHDLKQQLGAPYADYLDRVPRFVPRPKVSHGEH
ncbi:methanethiol S-methyltransferase [Paractinoplanes toevensis]|uniref:methanethiol S-methyltransferase n=1 Tax=Paractinoplanes toevensis TaxID=571911 RepID=A0A919TCV6_9ACTN|nr:methanethiol S-methyltransferase [Actinoplanes toevensis]GIM93225.1 membrane protein [Actinoplanes toevensis]